MEQTEVAVVDGELEHGISGVVSPELEQAWLELL